MFLSHFRFGSVKGPLTLSKSVAAVGNWLFNFALGLFVPPGFANITWKLFIVFGVLCVGAAIQVFFTYIFPSIVSSGLPKLTLTM